MKIKILRQQLGKTQEEVAVELGLPRTKYARYETEESKMSIEQLCQLANYFDVSLDYLCDRPFKNSIGYIPEERKAIIQQLIDLNESDFKEVSTFIRGYLAGRNKTSFQIFEN